MLLISACQRDEDRYISPSPNILPLITVIAHCISASYHLRRKTTILVKKGEEEVINTIESWLSSGDNADEKQIDAWSDQGLVFRSTPLGVRAMHLAETKGKKTVQTMRKPSVLKYALDMYIQVGTDR